MNELHIPEAAVVSAEGELSRDGCPALLPTVRRALDAAAPAIVAAELRRLAEALDAQAVGDSIAAETLRARADELDGGAS